MSNGRPIDGKIKEKIIELMTENKLPVKQIAAQLEISVFRIYEVIQEHPLFKWAAKKDKS